MAVSEWQGILKTALQNGAFRSKSIKSTPDEDGSEDEESDENWHNVLPVEVNVETVEDEKPSNGNVHSDSDSDFFGFEDGLIPVKTKVARLKLSKVSSHCPHCSYKTRRKDHFKRHVLRHPEQTLYPLDSFGIRERLERSCSMCGYTTLRLDHFKRHMMRHTGEKPYSCACGYSTTHAIHLKRHVLRFPNSTIHYSVTGNHALTGVSGGFPGKASILENDWEEDPANEVLPEGSMTDVSQRPEGENDVSGAHEMLSIINEDPFVNGDIGEWGIGLWPVEVKLEEGNGGVSDEENKLKKKRRGGPHVCKECGYSTMRGDHFKRHLMRHTGEKPYSCSICDYRSTHAIHLKRHMSTHTDDRPFSCSYCPFRAIRPHHLRDHERIHTGERPYVCELCGFSAAQSGNYRSHMRTHSDQSSHTCEICGYTTVKESNLMSHMRTHTGEYGYGCMLCEYRSVKSSEVLRHTKRVHNIELTTVTQTDISIYQGNNT